MTARGTRIEPPAAVSFLVGVQHADLARKAVSPGRNLRWDWYKLFGVFRDGRARRTLFVRPSRSGNARRPAREHGALLARVSPEHPARPALWISRSRSVGARQRAVVQSG